MPPGAYKCWPPGAYECWPPGAYKCWPPGAYECCQELPGLATALLAKLAKKYLGIATTIRTCTPAVHALCDPELVHV